MPVVGQRKNPNMGNMTKNPMYAYAAQFMDTQKQVLRESTVDYGLNPGQALIDEAAVQRLEEFFVNDHIVNPDKMTAAQLEDAKKGLHELFLNDVQAVRENAVAGLASWNPLVGLSLPMHKYLMLNCVFAQALPRFVAASPSWTETMETRYMVTPDGRKIDIANQQNEIFDAWKSVNRPVEVAIALPEAQNVDILNEYFHVSRVSHNLSVATHICAVAVEDYAVAGDTVITIDNDGKITESTAVNNGKALVWKPWKGEFNPGYGEYNRILSRPVDIVVNPTGATGAETVVHDSVMAAQVDNMFVINSTGTVKAVKMWARYDASSRMLKTNRVEWSERTTFVQIPENDGITVPITPEEVKDIGASYGINQVTKYMSIIKDILDNVKDDDIHEQLDESFGRLDTDHKIGKTIDFAPRQGYYSDHLTWLKDTFMNTLDQYITGLLTILRDPNMEICIIGRPAIIRQITPIEYAYSTPSNVGPIELDFKKTVVTSDKRVYNFISSDKMFTNDNLIVLLIPKNTDRITYRLYDYQMYISNEIRDAENPALPALTAFQRYKFFEYQPVQGRIFVANPTGLREHLPNIDPIGPQYANNDMGGVYTHYDPTTGLNAQTENTL